MKNAQLPYPAVWTYCLGQASCLTFYTAARLGY
jgi:hypothetical protein